MFLNTVSIELNNSHLLMAIISLTYEFGGRIMKSQKPKSIFGTIIVVCMLIGSVFGFIGTVSTPVVRDVTAPRDELLACDEPNIVFADGTRAGEDFIQIVDTDFFDSTGGGVNQFIIGHPNYEMDVDIDMIWGAFSDDNDESDGDNVLYDISARLGSAADTDGNSVTNPLSYDTATRTPTGSDRLTETSKNVAWFYSDSGTDSYLDDDNDGYLDSDEVEWVSSGQRSLNNYQFDVNPDAEPGLYDITMEVTYRYQTYQPFAETPGGLSPFNWMFAPEVPMGEWNYYYWVPWNVSSNDYPTNLTELALIGVYGLDLAPGNVSEDDDGDWQQNETVLHGSPIDGDGGWDTFEGTDSLMSWVDTDFSNDWEWGETIFRDENNDNQYNTGEPIVIGPTPANNTPSDDSGFGDWDWIMFDDIDFDNDWDLGESTWIDGSGAGWWNGQFDTMDDMNYNGVPDAGDGNVDEANEQGWPGSDDMDTPWLTFKKVVDYEDHSDEPWLDWEAFPDDDDWNWGTSSIPTVYDDVDGDCQNSWLDNGGADNATALAAIATAWTNYRVGYITPSWPNIDQDHTDSALDGNGTWEYTGYEGDVVWLTTVENETIRIEIVPGMDEDMMETVGVVDENNDAIRLFGNAEFQKVRIPVFNLLEGETVGDFEGVLTVPNSDFVLVNSQDTALIPSVTWLNLGYFNYRIDMDDVAPGVYFGTMDYEYTKVFDQNWAQQDYDVDDPDEYDNQIRVVRSLPVKFVVMFTPILTISATPGTIDQGTLEDTFNVTVTNDGNCDLFKVTAMLDLGWMAGKYFDSMDFYYDENGNLVYPALTRSIASLNEGQSTTLEFPAAIAKMLPAGEHRLPVTYSAYVTDPDGFVAGQTDTILLEVEWDNVAQDFYFHEIISPMVFADAYGWSNSHVILDVTDIVPDILADINDIEDGSTGWSTTFDLDGQTQDFDILVDINNLEDVDFVDLSATLAVGTGTPLLAPTDSLATTVEGVFTSDTLPASGTRTGKFNVDLDPTVLPGAYEVDLVVNCINGNTRSFVSKTLPVVIRVYPQSPQTIVSGFTLTNAAGTAIEKVSGGKEYSLAITVENFGGDARDVSVEFLGSGFNVLDELATSTNISIEDLGIGHYQEVLRAKETYDPITVEIVRQPMDDIASGGSQTVIYTIRVDEDIGSAIAYQSMVVVYSYDDSGRSYPTVSYITIESADTGEWEDDPELTLLEMAFIIVAIVVILLLVLFSSKSKKEGQKSEKHISAPTSPKPQPMPKPEPEPASLPEPELKESPGLDSGNVEDQGPQF
jgi:hypothetical protein